MQNLEDKCQNMQLDVDIFMAKFHILREEGLPNPLVINDKLMTQEDYNEKIKEVAKDQVNTSSMTALPIGKVLYQTFEKLFYFQHDVKHLFINKHTFSKYTEVDETYQMVTKLTIPDEKRLEELVNLLD